MPNDAPIFYVGNDSDETINGGDNNDTIYGGGGNDTINSNGGSDILYGEDGNDYLIGVAGGGHSMYGGAGNDLLQSSQLADYLDGGTGNDRMIANGENDTLIGGLGNDLYEGGRGTDLNVMTQEAGAVDILRQFQPIGGQDTIDMRDFSDLYAFEDLTLVQNGAHVEILLANDQKIIIENMSLANIAPGYFIFNEAPPPPLPDMFSSSTETVDLNTVVEADYAASTQTTNALEGNDAVVLADADNWAYTAGTMFSGGGGNDTITGGAQNDVMTGAAGNDQLSGGTGTDSFVFAQEAGAEDVITDFTSGADVIDLSDASLDAIVYMSDLAIADVEGGALLQLGNGHTLLLTGVTAASLTAADFIGVNPNPELFSSTTETVDLNTVAEADYAAGTQTTNALEGNDAVVLADADNWAYTAGTMFSGGDGNDTITGGTQNDVMTGAVGNDQLSGGAGIDSFVFTQEAGAADVIADFTSGEDVIDLSDTSLDAIVYMSDLDIADVEGGALLQLGNGHTLLLTGVTAASLTAADFIGVNPNPELFSANTETVDLNTVVEADYAASTQTTNALEGNDAVVLADADNWAYTAGTMFSGGGGNDTITGGAQNDVMTGAAGNDQLNGGAGTDSFVFTQEAGAADVIADFTSGEDVIDLSDSSLDAIVYMSDLDIADVEGGALLQLGNGHTLLLTGVTAASLTAADFIGVNPNPELFSANTETVDLNTVVEADYAAGTQTTNALEGDDAVILADADNWAYTAGAVFSGGGGNDTITGGMQNDVMTGAAGNDQLSGGAGADSFVFTQEAGAEDVITDFTSGADVIDLSDTSLDAIVYMSDLAIADDVGGARVQLGNGHSVLLTGITAASLTANDFIGVEEDPAQEPDPVTYGTEGNDVFEGSKETDLYNGLGGDDEINGGKGDDVLLGGAGNDSISGGKGNDSIEGGSGNDVLSGDGGEDTIDGGGGNDTISGSNGSDTLLGCNGNDVIYGNGGNDSIDGEAGNDVVIGGNGSDTLLGGDGNDIIHSGNGQDVLDGGAGNDVIYGGNSQDVIIGGSGDDLLMGANGKDTLIGGTGKDTMLGGLAKDTFVFESLADSTDASRDVIMDFGQGDKIDLSGMGFDGISQGGGAGSTLGYTQGWLSVVISDADSDFSITLLGWHSLDAGDFIF